MDPLEKGKQADLILVNLKQPHFVPIHDPLSEIVWAANGDDVDTVIIAGKIVMRHRTVLTMDEDAILNDVEAIKGKVLVQAGVKAQHTWAIK